MRNEKTILDLLQQAVKLSRKETHYISVITCFSEEKQKLKKEITGHFFDLEEAYRFVESQGYKYEQIYEMLSYETHCVECGASQRISLYFPTFHEVLELNYCHRCGSKFDDEYVNECNRQIHKNQKFYKKGRTVGNPKP